MTYYYNRNPEGVEVPKGSLRIDPEGFTRKAHYLIGGVEHKHCAHCNTWYPLDSFYNNASHWDGKDGSCKKCSREMTYDRDKGRDWD